MKDGEWFAMIVAWIMVFFGLASAISPGAGAWFSAATGAALFGYIGWQAWRGR